MNEIIHDYDQLFDAEITLAYQFGDEYFVRVSSDDYYDHSMYRIDPVQKTVNWTTIFDWMEHYQDDSTEIDPSEVRL